MDKKTLISLGLSFFILYTWSLFFAPRPNVQDPSIDQKQKVEDSLSVSKSSALDQPLNDVSSLEEKVYHIESATLDLTINQVGSYLKDLSLKENQQQLPITKIGLLAKRDNAFAVIDSSRNAVVLRQVFDQQEITYRYQLSDNGFNVNLSIDIKNLSDKSVVFDESLLVYQFVLDRLDNLEVSNQRAKTLYEVALKSSSNISRVKGLTKFKDKHNQTFSDVDWVGFRDQYYCFLFNPTYDIAKAQILVRSENVLDLFVEPDPISIEPGMTHQLNHHIYFGPQDPVELNNFSENASELISFKIGGFFDIMAFGLTDRIARLMLAYMKFLYNIVGNWGFVIVLFAISIFGITFPLTKKSTDSMQRMQSIQPQLTKLKKKYKDDPQQLQMEMVKLYQQEKINPFGGCLPIFIQMPIFISLYQLLWRAYQFKGAGFLWIKDLSEPDQLFTLPFNIPFVGSSLNILPIIYAILIFLQQKIQSKSMTHADPQQAEMQKMMMKIFPFLLGAIFYKFASGLTLYFTVYYSLTIIMHWYRSRSSEVVSKNVKK